MNYERFGIYVTIIIMVGILGFAGASSGQLGAEISSAVKLPNITSSTNTNNTQSQGDKSDGYYMWCYKMGYEC